MYTVYVQQKKPQSCVARFSGQAVGLPGLEDLRDAFDLFDSDKMLGTSRDIQQQQQGRHKPWSIAVSHGLYIRG